MAGSGALEWARTGPNGSERSEPDTGPTESPNYGSERPPASLWQ